MTSQPSLYKQIIATEEQVNTRIDELADEIIARYKDKNPLFVCLLRGGAPFAAKLMLAIVRKDPYFQPELDYMTIKTYGDELTDKPSKLIMDLSPGTKAKGRHAVILDDVLDKGVTAQFTEKYLLEMHRVKSVDFVVLVQKKRERKHYPQATLFGFEAPDGWLTGMGLDDPRIAKEANRWAGYVAAAN